MKKKTDSIDMLDALADEAARYEVEEGRPTLESWAAAVRYRSFVDDRLAALRRAELEQLRPARIEPQPICADLLELGRDALIARLIEMQERYPALGFSHSKLKKVTDDDLRTMIQDAEAAMEKVS